MSNLSCDIHMEDYSVPLYVVFHDQGEDVTVAVEEETLPIVEEL